MALLGFIVDLLLHCIFEVHFCSHCSSINFFIRRVNNKLTAKQGRLMISYIHNTKHCNKWKPHILKKVKKRE